MMPEYSLNKHEKLKRRKSIEALFRGGRSLHSPPLKLLYRKVEDNPSPALMTVAVPKKLVKRAVDRNLLKRRIREAYRQKKPELYRSINQVEGAYELIFLYQSTELADFKKINKAMDVLLFRFKKQFD